MVATGWILYQHYTAHTPTPLEYKWDLGPEECPGMESPEDIDSIYKIWYAQTAIALTAKWFWNTLQASLKTKFTWGVLLKVDLRQIVNNSPCRSDKWKEERTYQMCSSHYWPWLPARTTPHHPSLLMMGEIGQLGFTDRIKFLLFCVEILFWGELLV